MMPNQKNTNKRNLPLTSEDKEEQKRARKKRITRLIIIGIITLAILMYTIGEIFPSMFTAQKELLLCQKERKICLDSIVETANNHFANYSYVPPAPDKAIQIIYLLKKESTSLLKR